MTNLDSVLKVQRHHFTDKSLSSQSYGFSCGHIWMWELHHKGNWALKNWYFWTVMLEKPFKNSFDCKDIKSVNPKGNQPWIFIGRTDAEAEAPVIWPSDAKSQHWERQRAGGKRGNRGWDGWMASMTQWTWVWANCGRQWKTENPDVLQSMESQSVGHDSATEQQQLLAMVKVL